MNADSWTGLNIDDQNLHADRIKLWNDFNHAWLALFQRQKDMMESGQQLQRSQTLITEEGLEKMGRELIRLCDGVERHGNCAFDLSAVTRGNRRGTGGSGS